MSEKTEFELLPRCKLHLYAPYGGGAEFARLFRETWRQIPSRIRRVVSKHWSKDMGPFPDPRISLLPDWAGRPGEYDWTQEWEEATVYGAYLTFSKSVMEYAPPDVMRRIIAHEIALVYRSARGDQYPHVLIEQWGFMDSAAAAAEAAVT